MQTNNLEGFRLSPLQQRLWRLQRGQDNRAYRALGLVRLEGRVDQPVIEKALERIIARHEILRTTFQCPSGMSIAIQVVNPPATPSIRTYHLGDLDRQAQSARIDELFEELQASPFDLSHGPLVHVAFVELSPSDCRLLIGLSALCADASTLCNLLKELAAECGSLPEEGGEAPEGGPPQYADVAEWQLGLLGSDESKAGVEFWRKQLSATALTARVPFEKAAQAVAAFEPARECWAFDPYEAAGLRLAAARNKVSTAAFLLACWQALLWRLSGEPDLTVAVGCHGRSYAELEAALGLLTRYVPVRFNGDGDSPFSALLQRTGALLVESDDYQEYFNWDQLLAASAKSDRPPVLPVGFDFDSIPEQWRVSNGSGLSLERLYHCVDQFKIKLAIEERGELLSAALCYDRNLIEPADAERLMMLCRSLIGSAIAHPDLAIDRLNILSDDERRRVLVDFNDTSTRSENDRGIVRLIEEQVARVANKTAVVLENDELTYGQLNRRANQVARHLQKRGVGPGVMVALYLEQSTDILVGLLGILKAGGAYVPLDPEYPKERIGFILRDIQAPLVLTQRRLLTDLAALPGTTVCLDADWDAISGDSDTDPTSTVTPDDLAYVIYTSGSTGLPKGVAITHRNLAHSTSARASYYREPVDRYLLLSSFAFDSSVAGIFWTLCQGGTLILTPAGMQRDPAQVANLIERRSVTHVLGLPSLYALLLSETDTRKLASLRTVIVAGEACPVELVKSHRLRLGRSTLFNEYGPTEGTVWSTVFNCAHYEQGTSVPIGRPIANVRIYLLDRHQQPVPIGVPGELYIGGAGVARGYLDRPELTAERFIRNPLASLVGADGHGEQDRLYRTGDLGRYLPDGNIEFLGRVDQQVKIRGYRIELGEIEAILAQHEGVRETAVVVREDTPGDRRLVAYLSVQPAHAPGVEQLRAFLGEKLPEYMIPSAFVLLDTLPLSPNGKVDRQALPDPSRARPELGTTYSKPRSAVEEVLADIWAKVLDLERVGVHDNFFSLGGHSILVTRLVGQLRDALGVDVPLRSVFEAPTVAELAESLLREPNQRARVEKIAQVMIQVDELSDDDVTRMLEGRV